MSSVFLGLANLNLSCDVIDLGSGFVIKKTYAHLMAHGMIAFAPAENGRPHPAPWKPTRSGYMFDIHAELKMPTKIAGLSFTQDDLSQIMLGLLRLSVKPDIVAPLSSTHDLAEAKYAEDVLFEALESLPRFFPLSIHGKDEIGADDLAWLSHELKSTLTFFEKNVKARVALEVLSNVQFIMHRGMAMISLWAALESLFNVDNETTFKVSSYVAAYLKPYGHERHKLHSECKKLYHSRCGAAHSNKHTEPQDLLTTTQILREVLVKVIESKKVPDRESLDRLLFGSDQPESV